MTYPTRLMNCLTEISDAVNDNVELFFEWMRSHPRYALLFVAALLVFWLVGMLLRWKWALHWHNYSKLWFFDDCSPGTRRRVQIFLVSIALLADLLMFFVWK